MEGGDGFISILAREGKRSQSPLALGKSFLLLHCCLPSRRALFSMLFELVRSFREKGVGEFCGARKGGLCVRVAVVEM